MSVPLNFPPNPMKDESPTEPVEPALTDVGAVQINTPAAVQKWAEAKAAEALDVLADVGRNPGALPEEVEQKITALHTAAVELRNAARRE